MVSTVYDETRLKHHERHAMLFLLHVISWKKNVSDKYPLRVTCITEPKPLIGDIIEKLGAKIKICESRHPLYDRGPCYNKHLARPSENQNDRIFLTDNDTVYLGPIDQLFSESPSTVRVSFAGKPRISTEMWDVLIKEFKANPIQVCWLPEGAYAHSIMHGEKDKVTYQRYGYFNGGAILFPKGRKFWQIWENKSYALSQFLVDKGFHGQKSVGTDQASLCLAISEYGDWNLMPRGFNHSSFNYALGSIEPSHIRHIHVAGIGRHYGRLDKNEKTSASVLINKYWENAIIHPMKVMGRSDKEIDIAVNHRDFVLEIIDEFDLDDLRQFSLPKGKGGRTSLVEIHDSGYKRFINKVLSRFGV